MLRKEDRAALRELGVQSVRAGAYGIKAYRSPKSDSITVTCPIDNSPLGSVPCCTSSLYEQVVADAAQSFAAWRTVPAPRRGEVVRKIGLALRKHKKALARLVTLETGKILSEGEGEIQEAIDIADFAVGLSRQLYGLTMQSERRAHAMMEQWHPLGIVGVITAFNFPAAVWAWNAMIAAVCGDTIVWKPSEKTPLIAIAINTIAQSVAAAEGYTGIFNLVIGNGPALGERIAHDRRIPLVSATGSCRMGRAVGAAVGARLGRSLLELGGNNAVIVLDDANLDMVVRSTLFGAVGTAGQRCTTTRRLIVTPGIQKKLIERLVRSYAQVRIGDPRESTTLMGPLINTQAVDTYTDAVAEAVKQGGTVLYGGKKVRGQPSSLYVQPCIIQAKRSMPIVYEETFAPILYVLTAKDLNDAIALNNSVDQGFSSSIFTESSTSAHLFIAPSGSDCGIANINLGTSGAEIGGAFGGEKDTGGGRESGSDSWKQYMRRQTNTINYSGELPLAQGVKFE
jgi:aldehyde dehydrogenase (NAD+)